MKSTANAMPTRTEGTVMYPSSQSAALPENAMAIQNAAIQPASDRASLMNPRIRLITPEMPTMARIA